MKLDYNDQYTKIRSDDTAPKKTIISLSNIHHNQKNTSLNLNKNAQSSDSNLSPAHSAGILKDIHSLKDLKTYIQTQDLPFKNAHKNMVFGQGAQDAAYVFCGHAPTIEDEWAGKPFQGTKNTFLHNIIQAFHFKKDHIYTTNLTYWRALNDALPSKEDINAYKPFFLKELSLIRPKYVFLFGKIAIQTFFGDDQSFKKHIGKSITHCFNGHTILFLACPALNAMMNTPHQKKILWQLYTTYFTS